MGIRGFGTIFGEQQTGDVGNVGIDLFFEMLFESLSKVSLLFMIIIMFVSSFRKELSPLCLMARLLIIELIEL